MRRGASAMAEIELRQRGSSQDVTAYERVELEDASASCASGAAKAAHQLHHPPSPSQSVVSACYAFFEFCVQTFSQLAKHALSVGRWVESAQVRRFKPLHEDPGFKRRFQLGAVLHPYISAGKSCSSRQLVSCAICLLLGKAVQYTKLSGG